MINRVWRLAVLTMIATAPGALADAQRLADIPSHCTPTMTVQTRSCEVSHHMTCTDLPAGQFRVQTHGAEGRLYTKLYDDQGASLQQMNWRSGEISFDLPGAPDPLSMDELRQTGFDTYDLAFQFLNSPPYRMHGFDKLTGEMQVIDGRTLLVTNFEYTITDSDGAVVAKYAGHQFMDGKMNVIYPGQFHDRLGSNPVKDLSPMEFFYPGEAGFLSATPTYDCSVELAALTPNARNFTQNEEH